MAKFRGSFARDVINGTDSRDRIDGLRGDDALSGGGGKDKLFGRDGNDWLDGGWDNDRLIGGNGEDGFYGGAGNDVLDGRAPGDENDYDIAYYFDVYLDSGPSAGVTVNLKTGVATDAWGDTDRLIDIEGVDATSADDVLIGGNTDNDDWETFRGFAGDDLIDGGTGIDRADYGRDYRADGTGGNMGIIADLAARTVRDGFGDTDTVRNIEVIRATIFSDDLRGDNSDNRFDPLSGSDYIDGRGGRDMVSYNSDHFYDDRSGGSTGILADLRKGEIVNTTGYQIDTVVNIEDVRGSVLNDDIRGDGEDNLLQGDKGDDLLTGRNGNDTLEGGYGQDELVGGRGNDILEGDAGNDSLWGRIGSDTFIFAEGSDIDHIHDFKDGVDLIDVSAFGFANAAEVLTLARQTGDDVTIDFNDDDAVVIENFMLAALDAGDLIL